VKKATGLLDTEVGDEEYYVKININGKSSKKTRETSNGKWYYSISENATSSNYIHFAVYEADSGLLGADDFLGSVNFYLSNIYGKGSFNSYLKLSKGGYLYVQIYT